MPNLYALLPGRAQPSKLLRTGALLRVLATDMPASEQASQVSSRRQRPRRTNPHAKAVHTHGTHTLTCTDALTPARPRLRSCPFCKAANYSITYRGPLGAHEREQREADEQRVIELQIEKANREERASGERLSGAAEGGQPSRAAGAASASSSCASGPRGTSPTWTLPMPAGFGSRQAASASSPRRASPTHSHSESLLASVSAAPLDPLPLHP